MEPESSTVIATSHDLESGVLRPGPAMAAASSSSLKKAEAKAGYEPSEPPPPAYPKKRALRDFFGRRFAKFHVAYLTLLGIYLILAVVFIVLYIKERNKTDEDTGPLPRSVIFMIADGFGPASQTLARAVFTAQDPNYNRLNSEGKLKPLPLDDIAVASVRTLSYDRYVTDSAAGATAFACGKKTKNYFYATDSNNKPMATLIEAAKLQGMTTGVVVTSSVSHATPAAFTAHGNNREKEDSIVIQQMAPFTKDGKPLVDLMIGGGLCHFLPSTKAGSCRGTHREEDVLELAKQRNYTLITNRTSFDALTSDTPLPLLGLMANNFMDYEIERKADEQPSLAEMTKKALDIMEKQMEASESKGFFLLIEGSRIDMAAHDNDPATHAYEAIAYNNAIDVVKKFVKRHRSVLLISVADHETGGLSLGRANDVDYRIYPVPYSYYPDRLIIPFKQSLRTLANYLKSVTFGIGTNLSTDGENILWHTYASNRSHFLDDVQHRRKGLSPEICLNGSKITHALTEIVRERLNITHMNCTFAKLMNQTYNFIIKKDFPRLNSTGCQMPLTETEPQKKEYLDNEETHIDAIARSLGAILSAYAQVSWSTPGHTGEDITLYAMGPTSSGLRNSIENTEVFKHVEKFLSLDMRKASEHLLSIKQH